VSVNLGRVKLPVVNVLTHDLPVVVYVSRWRVKARPDDDATPLFFKGKMIHFEPYAVGDTTSTPAETRFVFKS